MDWIWVIKTVSFLFLIFVFSRIYYIKGYRAGAKMVIRQWKTTLNEEETEDEHI